jgi:aerobic C4-dicarboxylate transport protein
MSRQKHAFHRTLYFRVICGIVIGTVLGYLFPETAQALKPLGDAVIKLIKRMIAPFIFCTVVVGIAKMGAYERRLHAVLYG